MLLLLLWKSAICSIPSLLASFAKFNWRCVSHDLALHVHNRTPHTEEYVVKTYPSDFLFHLDPTDLPMEEHISTRNPSNFQEIQSYLQGIFSAPLDFYFFTSPDTLITLRIFRLIFKSPFGFSLPYPFFTHLHTPRISSYVWGVRIKNRMTHNISSSLEFASFSLVVTYNQLEGIFHWTFTA